MAAAMAGVTEVAVTVAAATAEVTVAAAMSVAGTGAACISVVRMSVVAE